MYPERNPFPIVPLKLGPFSLACFSFKTAVQHVDWRARGSWNVNLDDLNMNQQTIIDVESYDLI